ncbi:hypothetical protein HK096_011423 [Nowakowskiella sp. JEL0078]|nr:hypothetical protein HK096_011423 [Nowakowskiella sp. JEL0078]
MLILRLYIDWKLVIRTQPHGQLPASLQRFQLPAAPAGAPWFVMICRSARLLICLLAEQPQKRQKAPPVDYLELPLPNGVYRQEYKVFVPQQFQKGSSSVRYTAATSNWDEFAKPEHHYTLKQQEENMNTKIMVIVTMYNEDADLFVATLFAVYKNIEFIVDHEAETGINWDNIVVTIICDGRRKCPPEVKCALELLGIYQAEEQILTDFLEKPVYAHIFEHMAGSHLSYDKKRKEVSLEKSKYITQYLLLMKENNCKKIDSHGWAFKAFGPLLKPDVCILLDMGTKPEKESFYHLWMHFKDDEHLGGACGEIKVRVPGVSLPEKGWRLFSNPLLAAQNFEYKMSNILSKSLQSKDVILFGFFRKFTILSGLFGYITVLPGAFSAYRFKALEGKPLDEYFRREKPGDDDVDVGTWQAITTANKYLAEDRILAFEIFTKSLDNWSLRYVKEAKANTDAPDDLGTFMNQRRRWMNGSLFAFLSALFSLGAVNSTTHSIFTKIGFYFEMIYLLVDLIFSLIAPMNFYCVLVIMWNMFAEAYHLPRYITFFIIAIYALTFFFGMLVFIGNNPKGYASQWVYRLMSVIWGICTIVVFSLVIVNGVTTFKAAGQTPTLETVFKAFVYCIALLCSYGIYLIASLVFNDVYHVFTSMIGYLLFVPTSINMVLPFALANTHDVSWGTRAEEAGGRVLPKNKMKDTKAMVSGVSFTDTLFIDSQKIEKDLNDMGKEEDQKKAAKKRMSPEEKAAARKKARLDTLTDRQKTVRMILLLVFLSANLIGACLITLFGVYKKDLATDLKKDAPDIAFIYTTTIFGCIIVFSVIQMLGAVLFVVRTRRYKPGVEKSA